MKECKRGETLQVTIETATADGTGIARVDGQVVFVPGALPGEVCKIRIAHIGRSAVFAELLRVEQPSAHRVEPDCPYFPRCGGCALRHMDYAQELELKRAHVYNCLTRIGGQTLSSLPITGAEQIDGYRNKVQFPVQEQNGKPAAQAADSCPTSDSPCHKIPRPKASDCDHSRGTLRWSASAAAAPSASDKTPHIPPTV